MAANISLGGGPPSANLASAVGRATSAGVVVVVSAGNDGDSTDPAIDGAQPDPFAAGLRAAGNGLVIIAASVNDQRQISPFSNRAGSEANFVLSALGQRVCCEYRNGTLFQDQDGFVFLFNGTSFSAPQISGAVALLAQAFPNLSGAQIVDLLLRSARDAGDVGTDAVYGRGILDIAAAFAPRGATSVAGTRVAVDLNAAAGSLSAAMGDAAASQQGLGTVVLDGYQRAYQLNLAESVTAQAPPRRLFQAVGTRTRNVELGGANTSIALTMVPSSEGVSVQHPLSLTAFDAERAQLLAGALVQQIGPSDRIAIGLRHGADGLVARVQGRAGPAFLIAEAPDQQTGFAREPGQALAVRHALGRVGLTIAAENGWQASAAAATSVFNTRETGRYAKAAVLADGQLGKTSLGFGATVLDESSTILGAQLSPLLARGGATSLFADAWFRQAIGSYLSVSGQWRQGFTRLRAGSLAMRDTTIQTSAFSFDISRQSLLRSGDRLALRLAQPLRVTAGAIPLLLPVDYDYATLSAAFAPRRFNVAPDGREVMGELAYVMPWAGGQISAHGYYRHEPGHIANAPADIGIVLRLSHGF